MTYIAPRTEALARAMCVAVDINPDEQNSWLPPDAPDIDENKNLHEYLWPAQMWIYEHSGGELPEREGESGQ